MMKSRIKANFVILLGFLVGTLVLPAPAYSDVTGERNPWLVDDFVFSIGTFLPSKKFRAKVDGSLPGSDIDFGNSVDATSHDNTPSGTLRWRFGEKWSLWGQYFDTSDSGESVLERDIVWDDVVYHAGLRASAGVELTVARVFFGRNFSVGENYEFGAGAGLHSLKLGAYLEGEAFIEDQSIGFKRESVSARAPLPNIGAWYWYAFSPRWLLTTGIDWLGATIGDYSGDLWNVNAGVNFQVWDHVGLRLSYQLFKLNIDVSKDDWHGGADLNYSGPFASVNFNW